MEKDQGRFQEPQVGLVHREAPQEALPQWEQLPGGMRQELVNTLTEMLLGWLAWQVSRAQEGQHEPVS